MKGKYQRKRGGKQKIESKNWKTENNTGRQKKQCSGGNEKTVVVRVVSTRNRKTEKNARQKVGEMRRQHGGG